MVVESEENRDCCWHWLIDSLFALSLLDCWLDTRVEFFPLKLHKRVVLVERKEGIESVFSSSFPWNTETPTVMTRQSFSFFLLLQLQRSKTIKHSNHWLIIHTQSERLHRSDSESESVSMRDLWLFFFVLQTNSFSPLFSSSLLSVSSSLLGWTLIRDLYFGWIPSVSLNWLRRFFSSSSYASISTNSSSAEESTSNSKRSSTTISFYGGYLNGSKKTKSRSDLH